MSTMRAVKAAPLSVGQVSKLSGVTVRTLHHYDNVGLLVPSDRSRTGYRLYSANDIDRLQQILFYRELGFSLEAIAVLIDDPSVDPVTHLRRQRELLGERIDRLQSMVAAVDRELEANQMGIQLTPEQKLEVFGPDYRQEWEAEAEQRWADNAAYQQSQRKAASYTKDDWKRMTVEQEAAVIRFAEACAGGHAPDSIDAMDAAEAHRQFITRWFYECTLEIHRGLGQLYLADPRFAAHYENVAEGLAEYVDAAIQANADRQAWQ